MTHDRHVQVIDTQPEDPAKRVVNSFRNRDDAVQVAENLNAKFEEEQRAMARQGKRWSRAHKSWTWLRINCD